MISLIAHITLHGRHGITAVVNGLHWRYCAHRSHLLNLPCWRWFVYDSQCAKHNRTCWGACPADPFAVDIYETDAETDF